MTRQDVEVIVRITVDIDKVSEENITNELEDAMNRYPGIEDPEVLGFEWM